MRFLVQVLLWSMEFVIGNKSLTRHHRIFFSIGLAFALFLLAFCFTLFFRNFCGSLLVLFVLRVNKKYYMSTNEIIVPILNLLLTNEITLCIINLYINIRKRNVL